MQKVWIEKNTYRDSVSLMLSADLAAGLPGVNQVALLMATPANRERLAKSGFRVAGLAAAEPGDLLIGLDAADEQVLAQAYERIREDLRGARPARAGVETAPPRTLESAVSQFPEASLASISLPGEYASRETERALELGLHVFLFSDNVPIEEEVRLKRIARERGLMMMGPDCGTALINGVPLGFCNRVPAGRVGLVAASGTGAQAVMCRLAGLGAGVSHVIGTGGRDLTHEVGGLTFETGMRALALDPHTEVIILVSKQLASDMEERVRELATGLGKPVVLYMAGRVPPGGPDTGNLIRTETLDHAAETAVALVLGRDLPAPLDYARFRMQYGPELEAQVPEPEPGRRFVRGLFSGGTLAHEAARLLAGLLSAVSFDSAQNRSDRHTIVDLGDDRFTRGRPHPMIDFTLRSEQLEQAWRDPGTAVILTDIVLGTNAEMEPAAKLIEMIEDIRVAEGQSGQLVPVVVSLCGTAADPQDVTRQERLLRDAGMLVFQSNTEAAYAAAWIVQNRTGLAESEQQEEGT